MKAGVWGMLAAVLMTAEGWAQPPQTALPPAPAGAMAPGAPAGRMPLRHGPGVVLMFDPYDFSSGEAYANRQAEGARLSRPVFLDESDWRLPDARTLHRQIHFGKPGKPGSSGIQNLNVNKGTTE